MNPRYGTVAPSGQCAMNRTIYGVNLLGLQWVKKKQKIFFLIECLRWNVCKKCCDDSISSKNEFSSVVANGSHTTPDEVFEDPERRISGQIDKESN